MSNGNDINVDSIDEDINELKTLLFQDRLTNYGKRKMINYYENEITRQKQINEEHQKINGELREKVKELEKESKILEFQNKQIENYAEELKKYNKTVSDRIVEYKKNSIPKQVVKEGLEKIEDYFDRLNGPDEDIEYIKQIKQELLEGGK